MILGVEGLVTEVRTYLKNNLGPIFVEVDSRYPAKIGLEPVKDWRIDDPVNGQLPNLLPCGWVISGNMIVPQWNATGQLVESDLVVWILFSDSDASRLRQRTYRSTLAIWECLKKGHYDGSIRWVIIGDPEMDFSEVIAGGESQLFADCRVRVRVTIQELS